MPNTIGDTGYMAHGVDLFDHIPDLAGQTVRINFHQFVPETNTGPAQFDLDRTDGKKHLTFGFGTHFCLGAPLARRELLHGFTALVSRIDEMCRRNVPWTR